MTALRGWICPGCGKQIQVRAASEVFHECPQRNNRITVFRPELPDPEPPAA